VEGGVMANSGIVKTVIGNVKAIATDGTERVLQIGERILFNEQIITGDTGTIAIDFSDGTQMDLGRNSIATIDEDSLNAESGTKQNAQPLAQAEDDVATIQQALASDPNFDPSTLEAPAAGGITLLDDTESDGGYSVVGVEYLEPRQTPDNGFETIGVNNNDPLILNLFEADLVLQPGLPVLGVTLLTEPTVQVTRHIDLQVADNIIAEDATVAVTGTFVLTTPEGLASITVAGHVIVEADLLNSGTNSIAMNTDQGELIIDGFDAVTGTVNYSYLQDGMHKDHTDGDESVIDQIPITVTDDKSVTSIEDVLDILITDSVPTAIDNVEKISHNQTLLLDNVINNITSAEDNAADDLLGADGAKLFSVTFDGETKDFLTPSDLVQFGTEDFITFNTGNATLYIRDDGQYWYEDLVAPENQEVTDTFEYQLLDGDGDLSSATLTITQVLGSDINTGDGFV